MYTGAFLCTNRAISSAGQSFWYQVDNQIKVPAEGSPAIQLINHSVSKNCQSLHHSKADIFCQKHLSAD